MPIPSKSVIYETLNNTRHLPAPTQLSLFSKNDSDTDNEYWYYSDLHNLFGEGCFPTTCGIKNYTWTKIIMPYEQKLNTTYTPATPDFFDGHIIEFSHSYNLDGHSFKNANDLRISRYGCWCLSRDNPYMIFARTYFLSPIIRSDMNFSDMQILSYQFARPHLRHRLTQYERQLAGIINKHNGDFRQINHSMARTLFYGYSTADIKSHYHIPERTGDPIANYMGAASLNAKAAALHDAITIFNNAPRQNINVLSEILYHELTRQRIIMIHDLDTRPELDIFCTPVSQVENQMKHTERNFIYTYQNKRIR